MSQLLTILIFGFLLNDFDNKQGGVLVDSRDSNEYEIVQINGLNWLGENLRYRSASMQDTLIPTQDCGVFYLVEDAKTACPEGWRLPSEKDIQALIKENKKGRINLIDTLNIALCGRIDYDIHAKLGTQNTFWLNEDLEEGHITHWHIFGEVNETHSHDVVNARRKFPIRCVSEIE